MESFDTTVLIDVGKIVALINDKKFITANVGTTKDTMQIYDMEFYFYDKNDKIIGTQKYLSEKKNPKYKTSLLTIYEISLNGKKLELNPFLSNVFINIAMQSTNISSSLDCTRFVYYILTNEIVKKDTQIEVYHSCKDCNNQLVVGDVVFFTSSEEILKPNSKQTFTGFYLGKDTNGIEMFMGKMGFGSPTAIFDFENIKKYLQDHKNQTYYSKCSKLRISDHQYFHKIENFYHNNNFSYTYF